MDTVENVRQKLRQHKKQTIEATSGLTRAAVLLPFYQKDGEDHVLFTRRTDKVAYHRGQIAFPGGAWEEGDASLLDTALRESREEIGLDAGSVEVLGELDDTVTVSSNFVISPFVGLLSAPSFVLNSNEIEEIIPVPLAALRDPANIRKETQRTGGDGLPVYSYDYRGHVIWGATARILKQFLDVIEDGRTSLGRDG